MASGQWSVVNLRRSLAPGSWVLTAIALGLLASGGCELSTLLNPDADSSAVYITGVEGLNSPRVAEAGLYQPAFVFPIDPDNTTTGQATGFFVNISTPNPGHLQMRMLGSDDTPISTLLRIAPPPADALESWSGWVLPEEARDALRNGQGVFWLADASAPDLRAGVALPNGWTDASLRLQVYTATTTGGAPLTPDSIELAHDLFYMAAIGDSVVWGNGLREREKFSRLVAAEIQRRTHRRVILQVQAISGTRIVPDPTDIICRVQCNGEAQFANTSIITQVDLLEAPAALDLVLVDGCINDVSLGTILNPNTTTDALAGQISHFCHDEMVTLLDKVRATAPAATIVVTGYFQILSSESSILDVAQYLLAQDVSTDPTITGTFDQIVTLCAAFQSLSTQALGAAVQDATLAAGPTARIAYADPAFGPANAIFASQPLLWGLTADRIQAAAASAGLTLYPEDPLASLRASLCLQSGAPDPIGCLYASVGHPNPAGAQRYAQAILTQLEQLAILTP